MLVLAAASILCAQQAQVPSPQEVAAALQGGRQIARLAGFGEQISVSPDGAALALVHHEHKLARILDARTGKAHDAPMAGSVFSIALLPSGQGCWLGLEDGTVVHAPAHGELRRFEVAEHRIDGLVCVAGHVAWSSSKADRGGVLDARDGQPRFAVDVPFGGYRERRMWLTRDGRNALHFAPDPDQGGRRLVCVRDVRTGELLEQAPSYVSKRTAGVAVGLSEIFTAARVTSHRWELRGLDLVTRKSRVLDADLRGKHFVDLLLSPSARYLLEGDHEDRGGVLYDVREGGAPKKTLGAKGAMPVGFLADSMFGEEIAWSTADRRLGLSAWSTRTGGLLAQDVPFARGRRITRVGSLLGGRRIWVASWSSKAGRSIEYTLEVVAFDQPGADRGR